MEAIVVICIVVIWILCGITAAIIGKRKGEGGTAFVAGCILGPFGIFEALLSDGKQQQDEQKQQSAAQFSCVTCTTILRIRLLDGVARCPQCKSAYRVTRIHAESDAFLVIPQIHSTNGASPPPHQKRSVPPQVKAAYVALGLDETAEFTQARAAYRKLVHSYHPDKVSHLGPELKKVAEAKTKEFNEAISTIEKYERA